MTSQCLICKDSFSERDYNQFPYVEVLTDVFNVFCNYMEWDGAPSECQFDFTKDKFPFCKGCELTVLRVCRIHEKLLDYQQEIQKISVDVSSRILQSESDDELLISCDSNGDSVKAGRESDNNEKSRCYRNLVIKKVRPTDEDNDSVRPQLEMINLDPSSFSSAPSPAPSFISADSPADFLTNPASPFTLSDGESIEGQGGYHLRQISNYKVIHEEKFRAPKKGLSKRWNCDTCELTLENKKDLLKHLFSFCSRSGSDACNSKTKSKTLPNAAKRVKLVSLPKYDYNGCIVLKNPKGGFVCATCRVSRSLKSEICQHIEEEHIKSIEDVVDQDPLTDPLAIESTPTEENVISVTEDSDNPTLGPDNFYPRKSPWFIGTMYDDRVMQTSNTKFLLDSKCPFRLEGSEWKCLACDSIFLTKFVVVAHLIGAGHCPGVPSSDSVRVLAYKQMMYDEVGAGHFECRRCPFNSSQQVTLHEHIDTCHISSGLTTTRESPQKSSNSETRKTPAVEADRPAEEDLRSKVNGPMHQCPSCPSFLGTKAMMDKHLKAVHSSGNNPKRICQLCWFRFDTLPALRKHQEIAHVSHL